MKTKAMTSSSSSRADSGTRASRRGSLQPPGPAQVVQPAPVPGVTEAGGDSTLAKAPQEADQT